MKNQKGFTLIELLIVIGIIAILAAAVIIAINPGRQFQQARNATRWSHMNSVVNAVYSYAISNGGSFPSCIPTDGNAVDLVDCQDDLVTTGGFMSDLPEDPSIGGDSYEYDFNDDGTSTTSTCTTDCTGYVIQFEGADNNRIKISSAAQEAIDNDVEVVQ